MPSDDHAIGDGRTIPRGALVQYREWYGAASPNVGLKLTAEEVAQGVIGRSVTRATPTPLLTLPCLPERRPIACRADDARWPDRRKAGRQQADRDQAARIGGWDQMRARIKGDGENPMLFVFHTCRDFIRTVPALQHDPDRPEDCDSAGEDHAADECRYACMSRPYVALPVKPPPKPDEWNLTINPNGTVSYTEGFSVFNWAEARRKRRERDGGIYPLETRRDV